MHISYCISLLHRIFKRLVLNLLKSIKFFSLTFKSHYKLTPNLFSSFTAHHLTLHIYSLPNSLVVLVVPVPLSPVLFFSSLCLFPQFPPSWTTVHSADFWNLLMTKSRSFIILFLNMISPPTELSSHFELIF